MSNIEKDKLGLLHVYCGDGKGKTTAAMGLALRALANGFQVVICQFLKDGSSGELKILADLPEVLIITNKNINKFSFKMNNDEKEKCFQAHMEIFKEGVKTSKAKPTLIIFDEILGALDKNLMDKNIVMKFLKSDRNNNEVILTGRNPSVDVLEIADYVTEMKKIKHPYDQGISARIGIEK